MVKVAERILIVVFHTCNLAVVLGNAVFIVGYLLLVFSINGSLHFPKLPLPVFLQSSNVILLHIQPTNQIIIPIHTNIQLVMKLTDLHDFLIHNFLNFSLIHSDWLIVLILKIRPDLCFLYVSSINLFQF